jgi:acetyl esterase/lipase
MTSEAIEKFIEQATPLEVAGIPDLESFPAWRVEFDKVLGAGCPLASDIASRKGSLGGVRGMWFEPPEQLDHAVVLYLHGGGYMTSSPTGHAGMIGEVARATKRPTFAVDYRLAPENKFPAQRDDAIAAYRALLDKGFGGDQIVVVGDSAGGGLALVLAMAVRDLGLPRPLGVVMVSPWTDLSNSGESNTAIADPVFASDVLVKMAEFVAGDTDLRNPELSPLYGDFKGLPPLLFMAGEVEALRDDTVRAGRRAEEAGLDVTTLVLPGLVHVWPWFVPGAPESAQAHATIAQWVDERMAAWALWTQRR